MRIPATLIDRLHNGRVVPFVGAGVSMAVLDRDSHERLFPNWSELLFAAADRLDHESKPEDSNLIRSVLRVSNPDFLYAATHARTALGPLWYQFLKDELDIPYSRVEGSSLELARSIWRLGSQLVITTNYDEVLRWACLESNDVQTWDIQAPAEQIQLLQRGVQRPTVWHLHGRISNASRMILDVESYKLLYPEAAPGTETIYKAALETLRQQITSKSLLFVGFSLDDKFLGRQLQGMDDLFQGASGPHYILIREADKEHLQYLNLPVEPITFESHGPPLVELLRELARASEDEQPVNAGSATSLPTATRLAEYDPSHYVFHVPFRQKGNEIVGQEQALQNVRRQLMVGKRTAIGQTAAFRGLGGLGKTQLAVEYAYRHRDDYPNGVIWINADQDIDAQLIEIAQKGRWISPASEHQHKLQIAQQRLRRYSDCLIVFDNLDDREVINDYLPEPQAAPHILVTSRTDFVDFIPVPLELLDQNLSFELLIQEARRKPNGDDEEAAAREIVLSLGGLPLALELAGAYLSHRPEASFEKYRDLLRNDLKRALPENLSSFTKHEADLYHTLSLSEGLLKDDATLRRILDLLTWSASAPMSAALISRLLKDSDEADLIRALALGSTLRLLQKSEGAESYSLHRLVGEVRRGDFKLEENLDWIDDVCQGLGDWFQERRQDFAYLPLFEAEIDHLASWQRHAAGFAVRHASRLMWLQAYPAYHRGRYAASRDFVIEAQCLFRELNLADGELSANLLNDLATTDSMLGSFDSVLENYRNALEIRKELFGEQHPDIATSLNNVGNCYGEQGDLKAALEYAQQALTMRRVLFGEQHPDIAASLNNVGSCYGEQGDLKAALEYAQQALTMQRALFGEQHPAIATSLNNVGHWYGQQGDLKAALEYAQQALTMRRALFGEQHPDIATSLSNVGSWYGEQGDQRTALEYAQQALTMRRALFGEQHPDIATSLNNIGRWYSDQGDQRTALEYVQQALTMRRALFGEQHADIATSLNNVSSCYGEQGDLKTALEYIQQALTIQRALFGEQHPDIASSLSNFGYWSGRQGNLKAALEYAQEALTMRRALFGEQHPDVAISLTNVGHLYGEQGDLKADLEYTQRALTMQQEVLGEQHPSTVQNAANVAIILIRLNRRLDAYQLVEKFLRRVPTNHPRTEQLQQLKQQLLSQPLQKGFRQPPKGKGKRRRR